jgi:uncharacterized protein with von Willebrand factor type A (vWA) domain
VLRQPLSPVQKGLDVFRDVPGFLSESTARFHEDRDQLREQGAALLQDPTIQSFLRDYPDEAAAVQSELIRQLRSRPGTSKDSDAMLDREERLLAAFRDTDARLLAERWGQNNRYRAFLAANYEENEIHLLSHDHEVRRLRSEEIDEPKRFETFKEKIIDDWESARETRQRTLRSRLNEEQARQILEEMKSRIAAFRAWAELLSPIRRYFASAWDLSESVQHEAVFDLFQRSEHILQQHKQIQAIADRLGRLDEAESEQTRRTLKSFSKPRRPIINRAAKSSVIGIRESDDISAMISSEAVLLSSSTTENLFYLKFAEKKLLTYDYQPEARSRATALRGKVREKFRVSRRGPIILAVDTSASMIGECEQDAKALALALVRIAFRQRRSVHVISFSHATDSIVLTAEKRGSLEKLIQFLSLSFHGGTDLALALEEGITMLRQPEFRKADLVFLTDGDAPTLERDQVRAMTKAREQGVRFYSLLVGDYANEKLLRQFDFNWQYYESRLSEVALNLEGFQWDRLIPETN